MPRDEEGRTEVPDGCYICQPNNPDAAEEGCPTCDREFWAAAIALSRALTERPVRRSAATDREA